MANVTRLLSLSKEGLRSVGVLAELNSLAESFQTVGPIQSALLVQRLADKNPAHPVHVKTLNALLVNVVGSAAHLPTPIAVQTFSSLAMAGHPVSGRILSSLQDRWFDHWNPASVSKGTSRPKLKQNFVGIYSDKVDGGSQVRNASVIRNLDDTVLHEAVVALAKLGMKSEKAQVELITKSLVSEYSKRMTGREHEITPELQQFISLVGTS